MTMHCNVNVKVNVNLAVSADILIIGNVNFNACVF